MVGTRAALVVAALASLSISVASPASLDVKERANVAVKAPYAPDLYSRAELQHEDEEELLEKREHSKRPYAPELFSRSLLDEETESDFTVRSQLQYGQMFYSSHADGILGCSMECSESQFCSFASGHCQEKLALKSDCNEDSACVSGYCGSKGKCAAKKTLGVKCSPGLHQSCATNYCSVTSNTCKIKQSVGGACLVSAGCQDGLNCINKQCHEIGAVMAPRKRSLDHIPGQEVSKRTFYWGPKPSGYNWPAWPRKRDEIEEPTKRWFVWNPSPSGYNKPIWMKREASAIQKEEPSKRTFSWGSYPSGYGKPIWMHKREVEEEKKKRDLLDASLNQEYTERSFNGGSSTSGDAESVWMKSRSEAEEETVVEKREVATGTTPSINEAPSKRHWKPSPSGYFNPIPLYPYQKPPKNWWYGNNGGY